MATMKFNQIDETYPRAGENNSSQGFRDNFNYIKESLEYTDDTLDQLNLVSVKLNQTNTFTQEGVLDNVKLQNISETVLVGDSTITTNITLDYKDGSYQSLVLGSNVQINLSGFPAVDGITEKGRFAKLRLEILSNLAQTRTLFFNPPGAGTILYSNNWPEELSVSSNTEPVIVEFFTRNGGNVIYASYLGTFGQETSTAVFNNITVKGDSTLGDNTLNDVVSFVAVPKVPSISTTNVNDISDPVEGMIVFNSTTKKFLGYNGTNWVELG